MEEKSKESKEQNKLSHLPVELGDEVMDKESKRLGFVHRTKVFGKHNFYVKWFDNGQLQGFLSRKSQQAIIKTGKNINDSDSDSD